MVESNLKNYFDTQRVEWIVLTKAPIAGRVKTRLIPALGEQGACDVYKQLLMRLQRSLKEVVANSTSQIALWVAGDIEDEAFNTWRSDELFADKVSFYRQPKGNDVSTTVDLGERMALAVQSSLKRGCMPVLIGVDVPDLNVTYLLNCLQQLQKHDLVISPAEDGGYGLLGMKQFHPQLFLHKTWGTDTVFRDTESDLEQLKSQQGLRVAILPEVWDVDEVEDVERFRIIQF